MENKKNLSSNGNENISITDHNGNKHQFPKRKVQVLETVEPNEQSINRRPLSHTDGSVAATTADGKLGRGPTLSFNNAHGENTRARKMPPQE